MATLLIIIHVIVSLFLIAIILLQHGKGADAGATFGGGGSSQTLFGSEGPVPLLNKITTFSAIVFMGTSVSLAYISAHKSGGSVMSSLPKKEAAAPAKKEAPVTIPMPTAAKEEAAPVQPEQAKAVEPAQKTENKQQVVEPTPNAAVQQKEEAKSAAQAQAVEQQSAPVEKKAQQ